MTPIFNTSWEYPRISCLVQIWWVSLKSVKSYCAYKIQIRWSSRTTINSQINRELNHGVLHILSKFGGSSFNWGWFIGWNYWKWGKLWLWSSNWPWKSRSIAPQNNRDLNQVVLHLWSKLGDHSLSSLVQNQTLVTVWRRIPKLVANVSYEFHHFPWENKWSLWAHGGHGSGDNDHGSVTPRLGHSSVTARLQLSHG